MSDYDVILIHPPARYDFREAPLFTGALGSSPEQIQFNKVPIGMLSIAEFLDRHGYRVIVDNLGDRMVQDPGFDADAHLQALSAKVIAIGLNFQQHAPGAIEVARRCKACHPEATIVMGGLTATCFHEEIIRKYPFVDAVIRAEGEKPLLRFMKALERTGEIGNTPNLTFRTETGEVRSTALLPASRDLDDFEYTRFDLIEPKTSIYPPNAPPRYSLAVCRGCLYNCAICGGSAASYRKNLGMERPAFRSSAKILGDIRHLKAQGVRFVGLFQDPRMGGKVYAAELLAGLAAESAGLDRLSLDLLGPADEDYIRQVAAIGPQVVIHFCPDTGCDAVRKRLGRPYDNAQLMETIRLCHQYHIPVTTFFSAGLAGESPENVHETWDLWERLDALDRQSQLCGDLKVPLGGPITGPIVIDPGSLAFENPEKYGYRLLYKNLEEYIEGLNQPSWHQWLNYETETLDKTALVDLVLTTMEFAVDQREEAGLYPPWQAAAERLKTQLDRVLVEEIGELMTITEPEERRAALQRLRDKREAFLLSNNCAA